MTLLNLTSPTTFSASPQVAIHPWSNFHRFSQFSEARPGSPSSSKKQTTVASLMDVTGVSAISKMSSNVGGVSEEEYDRQAKLLQEFYEIPSIEEVWISKACTGNGLQAMVSMSQMNLPANKKRTFVLSTHIPEEIDNPASCHWSPFPVEHIGASLVVPSPSGLNLLVVRNGEPASKDASTSVQLEIWGPAQLRKEIFVPPSVHGPLYTDGWFQGISWNWDETCIAYVAEEPATSQPVFTSSGYKAGASGEKEPGSWKGQGDWLEDWGETYSGKRRPALFLLNIKSGTVQAVEGIPNNLSVGQVVWGPPAPVNCCQYLVFVGWSPDAGNSKTPRKLGMKYCYNRTCALYALRSPLSKRDSSEEITVALKLTEQINSAFLPCFSPNGKFLIFLSASTAVTTGAHCATNSLHRLHWPSDGILHPNLETEVVIPVVMRAEKGSFPGLYCTNILARPWLSDGHTIVLSSVWGSMQVLLAVNVLSGNVSRISPEDSNSSWSVLAVQDNSILAVSSSLVNPQSLNYGRLLKMEAGDGQRLMWRWLDIPVPFMDYSENVKALLSSIDFKILKIPVVDHETALAEGAKQPFEAIYVSSKVEDSQNLERNAGRDTCNPLIVVLHGGPHSTSLTSYSKSFAFLSSLGYNLLLVNYRGSLGYGEDALQSLLGNIGRQDVADVLAAIDIVVSKGLADQTNIAVLGGSHGGFLATHLIGQAPDRFVTAALRNPVCNLSLMVGTSDIPDWCYVETYGRHGKKAYTEAPSMEDLSMLYHTSPISHISKVKVPTLFLLGAQDLRVPISNGLQYVRALREKGLEVKVIVFPSDRHAIDRPQSDFESFVNIGVWFKRFFK